MYLGESYLYGVTTEATVVKKLAYLCGEVVTLWTHQELVLLVEGLHTRNSVLLDIGAPNAQDIQTTGDSL